MKTGMPPYRGKHRKPTRVDKLRGWCQSLFWEENLF